MVHRRAFLDRRPPVSFGTGFNASHLTQYMYRSFWGRFYWSDDIAKSVIALKEMVVNRVTGLFLQAQLTNRKSTECNQKYLNSTTKTKDTEVLGRQRAKPSKIKRRSNRPTCKNYTCHCNDIQYCSTGTDLLIFALPLDQHHISVVAKWR